MVALSLAAFASGLSAAPPGKPLQLEFTRSMLPTADFGESRVRGIENRVAIRSASSPVGDIQFRWALDYAYQRFEYRDLASRNRDLHRLELPLSWQRNAPLSWTVELRPVIASSSNVFKEFWSRNSSDDYMWHGRAILERSSVGSGWRLGAARDDAFGRESTYPVLAVLRQADGIQLELGWPVSRIVLEGGRRIELGGELAPAGARWHVVSDERGGASFDYEVRAWRAGGFLHWRSACGFLLTSRAGLEFERRHRLEDDRGVVINRAAGEAAFIELSAAYRW